MSGAAYTFIEPEFTLHRALQDDPRINPDHPTVVMLGDSHMQHVDWKAITGCASIANYGIVGNTSTQILDRLPDTISKHPKFVFLIAGTNDPFKGVTVDQTLNNIRAMKSELEAAKTPYRVVAPPPLPAHQEAVDETAKEATMHVDFRLDDLAADGMHLTRSGYRKFRDAVLPIVKEYCR